MVYSCAYFEKAPSTAYPLEDAQRAKLDLVARKLGLQPGMRVLDVGCGWGGFVIHAAKEYGVQAVGVTLSQEQAALARQRVESEGLGDLVEIRVQDYRDVPDGPYDAIASIGMAEHVGMAQLPEYAGRLHSLLAPGGRLLNHASLRYPCPSGPTQGNSPSRPPLTGSGKTCDSRRGLSECSNGRDECWWACGARWVRAVCYLCRIPRAGMPTPGYRSRPCLPRWSGRRPALVPSLLGLAHVQELPPRWPGGRRDRRKPRDDVSA